MKTTKKIFMLIIGLSIISLNNSFSQSAMGQYEQKQICTNFLDLNEAQSKKVEELRLNHQKSLLDIRNQLNEKYARKNTLETAETNDAKSINKLNEEIGKLKTDQMNLCSNHKQEVRKILTPEQKIKYDSSCSRNNMNNCNNSRMGRRNINNRQGGNQGMMRRNDCMNMRNNN